MNGTRSSKAYSLVEVMVAVLIAVNVLVILWQVFIADQRRWARDQGKLGALQGALVFAERLENDLREIALRVPIPQLTGQSFTLDDPVRIEDAGRRLSFLKFDKPDPAAPLAPVQTVTYAYDPARFKMVRAVGADAQLMRSMLVDQILFEGKSVTLRVGQLGLTPDPKLFRPDLPLFLVKYQITASPETPGSVTPADVPAEHKVTLVNSVPILYRAERANHPWWSFGASELPGEPR